MTHCRGSALSQPSRQSVEREVHHRCRIERQDLADDQPADNGNAKRSPQFRSDPRTHGQRQRAKQGRHRRHHDWTEPEQAGLIDRLLRPLPFLPLRLQRKVDHHNGVLLDDADQEYDADQGDHAELGPEEHQREQRPDSR